MTTDSIKVNEARGLQAKKLYEQVEQGAVLYLYDLTQPADDNKQVLP